jgi:hypothetical protein
MQLKQFLADKCDQNRTYKTDAIEIAPATTNKHTYKTRTITKTSSYFQKQCIVIQNTGFILGGGS